MAVSPEIAKWLQDRRDNLTEHNPLAELCVFWIDMLAEACPIDRRVMPVEANGISGCCTENQRFAINEMVRLYGQNGVYLEVGTLRGASLLSAAIDNPSTLCVGMDNFSELNGIENYPNLLRNLSVFNLPSVRFVRDEFFGAVQSGVIANYIDGRTVDVYMYDGMHTKYLQYTGLVSMVPLLSEKCIVIVDDLNWAFVEEPTMAFVDEYGFTVEFSVKNNEHWGNGFAILSRGY